MFGRKYPRYLLLLLFLSIIFIFKMKLEGRTSHLNFNDHIASTLSGYEESGIACDLLRKVRFSNGFLSDKETRLTHCTRGPNTTKRGSLNIKANSNHGSFNIVMSLKVDSECGFAYAGFREKQAPKSATPCEQFVEKGTDAHVQQSIHSVLGTGCRANEYALDLGSNIGYFTLQMRSFGCSVFAVEPQWDLLQMSIASLKTNSWWHDGRVTLFHGGVGPRSAVIEIKGKQLWRPGGDLGGDASLRQMQIIPLSMIMGDLHFRMIKLDIDGPEALILSQLADHAAQFDSMIAELTWSEYELRYNVSHDFAQQQLERLYDADFEAYLLIFKESKDSEEEFSKYLRMILERLEQTSVLSIKLCFKIPKTMFRLVMDMNKKVTKTIFFIKKTIKKKIFQ